MNQDMIPAASPIIGDEERAAVDRVMRSGMIAQGPEVAAFEGEFAELAGGATCVAVNSGTSALHMGLIAAGVRPGDEVIVPSFTFAATGNAVALVGATPVFVDVEEDYFCLDPDAVEAAVTDKTVGIMPVHLYGHPADMSALRQIADKHGLAIYEDAAQAHGAEFAGQRVGSFGTLGAELATPLVMVLAEVAQNAMLHAYPGGGDGNQVTIDVTRTAREITVRVTDDGQGLPPRFSLERTAGLGLQIVRTLVDSELGGSIGMRRRDPGPGTEVVVRVPLRSRS